MFILNSKWKPPFSDLQNNLREQLGQTGLFRSIKRAAAPQDFRRYVDADMDVGVRTQPVSEFGRHGLYNPLGDKP